MEQDYGYPKTPEDQLDPDWWKEERVRLATDPRHNPNLISQDGQEFWDNATRFPWAKTILKKEQHWNGRRDTWGEQYKRVNEMNKTRQTLGEIGGLAAQIQILGYRIELHLPLKKIQEKKKSGNGEIRECHSSISPVL